MGSSVIGVVWCAVCAVVANLFFVSGLLLATVVHILLLLVTPIIGSHAAYMGHVFATTLIARSIIMMLIINGTSVEFSESVLELPDDDSVLLLCNHSAAADAYLHTIFSKLKRRLFYGKYFSKESVKWIPFAGLCMWVGGHIFLQRNWFQDQSTMRKTFKYYTDGKFPAWLMFFPEGSRMSDSKRLECLEFCKKNNYPPLEHLLYPRTKGFVASINALRSSHINVIYDMTIAYQRKSDGKFGAAPSLIDLHFGKIADYRIHIDVQRFEMNDLPSSDDEKALSRWLVDRYYQKDAYLNDLKKAWSQNHDLESESKTGPLKIKAH